MEHHNAEETFQIMEELNLFDYLDWRVVLKGYLTAPPMQFQLWLRKRVHFVITRGLLTDNRSKSRTIRLLVISLGQIADLDVSDEVYFGMEVPEDFVLPDLDFFLHCIRNCKYVVEQIPAMVGNENGPLSSFQPIGTDNYLEHLSIWSRFLPHSMITRALSVCCIEECVRWMQCTFESILENLPLTTYFFDAFAGPLFQLPFFDSNGAQQVEFPARNFQLCMKSSADVIRLDVYTYKEVLVGVRGPHGNIVTIELPPLPLYYPVGPNHFLFCPQLVKRWLPDTFINRDRAYIVNSRPT